MHIIQTGICSFGMSGQVFHAPFIQNHPQFALHAIVERSKNASQEKYPDATIYRSVAEMLTNSRIELVVINTPVRTHFEYTKMAILAHKNVVVEKPFTITATEAAELVQLAQEHNVKLTVYQNRRYDADFIAIKNILASGCLGEIKEAEIRYNRYRPELSAKLHKETAEPGGGILYDLGAHIIDQALILFGKPTALFTDMAIMRTNSEVNDYFEIILYYPSFRVRIASTCFAKHTAYDYILHGSMGSYLQKRSDMQEELLINGVQPSIQPWCPIPTQPDALLDIVNTEGEASLQYITNPQGNYMNFYTDLYNYLQNQNSNPVPGENAVNTIAIIEKAMQSAIEKRVIEL